MLTTTPKVGDHVYAVYTRDYSSRTARPKKLLPVDKVGTKYLWVDGNKFEFNGRGGSGNTGYELFDSEEAYNRHLQRNRNITRIKKAVSAWGFGDGLSDEGVEQIIRLIEVK